MGCFSYPVFFKIFFFPLDKLHSLWDPDSLTRDRTWAMAVKPQNPNH